MRSEALPDAWKTSANRAVVCAIAPNIEPQKAPYPACTAAANAMPVRTDWTMPAFTLDEQSSEKSSICRTVLRVRNSGLAALLPISTTCAKYRWYVAERRFVNAGKNSRATMMFPFVKFVGEPRGIVRSPKELSR